MRMLGLFDRPASEDCLRALRKRPLIKGITEQVVNFDDNKWRRAITRLRGVRLLAPVDLAAPEALDAHPLVRAWFGERFKEENIVAWRAAHSVLYDHLRRTTMEGVWPTLGDLEPLYQAVAHGCSAARHREAFQEIYLKRINKYYDENLRNYPQKVLGAFGSELAAVSSFFVKPYEGVVEALALDQQIFVLSQAGGCLAAVGRFGEALPALRASLQMSLVMYQATKDGYNSEVTKDWCSNVAATAGTLSHKEFLLGNIDVATRSHRFALEHAKRSGNKNLIAACEVDQAVLLHATGMCEEAECKLFHANEHFRELYPHHKISKLNPLGYYDLLLSRGDYVIVQELAQGNLGWGAELSKVSQIFAHRDLSALGRAHLGRSLLDAERQSRCFHMRAAVATLSDASVSARLRGTVEAVPPVLLARAAFRRSIGDWDGAKKDLDDTQEIAEPGPMRLFLCDTALERARLCFAIIEAFAPLNGMLEDSPPKPVAPDAAESARLRAEATASLDEARKLVMDCGYHRRDDELAELEAALTGSRRFAELPPRV